ncbi:MAG: hypothetical protein LBM95_00410, partial [Lactobacillales bacterium]|nr:hypothetical protein [Lactobacillales bacterium]
KTGSELSVKSRYIEKNRPENQISIFWSIYFGELELIVPASFISYISTLTSKKFQPILFQLFLRIIQNISLCLF